MTIERIKGNISFLCDFKGCDEGLETSSGDFTKASAQAKEEGWLTRKRGDRWFNFCCEQHEEGHFRTWPPAGQKS